MTEFISRAGLQVGGWHLKGKIKEFLDKIYKIIF